MAFVPEGQVIVARHEVPGIDVKRLRPGGTVEVIVSPNVSRIGSIVPLDGAIFLVIPGTFVPGYYRAVPSGTKPIASGLALS
jgi:hypothetical protein